MTEEPVAAHVALLRAYANTVDEETGTDVLADAGGLTAWLQEQGLLDPDGTADEDDLQVARALRDGLRAVLAARSPAPEPAPESLDAATAALPLQVRLTAEGPRLEPLCAGARGALARVLVAAEQCRLDGSWDRLKLCPAADCRWAFYDTSRNRTRVWCAMGVCGNRTKTRAYRARRRGSPSS